jgi:hypothetical protein
MNTEIQAEAQALMHGVYWQPGAESVWYAMMAEPAKSVSGRLKQGAQRAPRPKTNESCEPYCRRFSRLTPKQRRGMTACFALGLSKGQIMGWFSPNAHTGEIRIFWPEAPIPWERDPQKREKQQARATGWWLVPQKMIAQAEALITLLMPYQYGFGGGPDHDQHKALRNRLRVLIRRHSDYGAWAGPREPLTPRPLSLAERFPPEPWLADLIFRNEVRAQVRATPKPNLPPDVAPKRRRRKWICGIKGCCQ